MWWQKNDVDCWGERPKTAYFQVSDIPEYQLLCLIQLLVWARY